MQTITYDDGTKRTFYDTLEELLKIRLDKIREDKKYYYIFPIPNDFYDRTIYKVDKSTHKAICIDGLLDYDVKGMDEKTKSVDIKTLKRAS